MTREYAISIIKELIETYKYNLTKSPSSEYLGDAARNIFGNTIAALEMAVNSLEVDEKYDILYESAQDFPKYIPCDFCKWTKDKDVACMSCPADWGEEGEP